MNCFLWTTASIDRCYAFQLSQVTVLPIILPLQSMGFLLPASDISFFNICCKITKTIQHILGYCLSSTPLLIPISGLVMVILVLVRCKFSNLNFLSYKKSKKWCFLIWMWFSHICSFSLLAPTSPTYCFQGFYTH